MQRILTPADMEAYRRIIVAVVVIAFPATGGEVVRSRVSPIDEDQSTYVPMTRDHR